MIDKTKSLIESLYEGTKVLYGDTDSVMIRCLSDEHAPDQERLATAMAFGKEAAQKVSSYFLHPIKL